MKAALIFLIFGALLSINYAAQLVGPTPCEVTIHSLFLSLYCYCLIVIGY